MQCNVGNKSPILICSLIPDSSETCHLELEFEEEDEVVFSVIGQRSVHLSGYYTVSGRINDGDDEYPSNMLICFYLVQAMQSILNCSLEKL